MHSQAYAPEDNTVSACMEDFRSGKADAVIIDEPLLRYEIIKYGKNADMRIVPGPSTITLSPVVAANTHNSFQHHFEQAAIRLFSDEKQVKTMQVNKDHYGTLFSDGRYCRRERRVFIVPR